MALIFGIAGALRRIEFVELTIANVIILEEALLVKIIKTKNHVPRTFTITGPLFDICMKYISARPPNCKTDRFFLKYYKGCCTQQVIGINKIGSMPKDIASYLNLPNANLYTGHSFRRSSATLLVDAGADLLTLQRHGGWKSGNVAYGYITNSMTNKKRIFDQISSGIVISEKPTSSNVNPDKESIPSNTETKKRTAMLPILNSTSDTTIPSKVRKLHEGNTSTDSTKIHSNTHRVPLQELERNRSSVSHPNSGISYNGTVHVQACVPRSQILYHPDIGLYAPDLPDENSNKVLVFHNCNVTIDGTYSALIFNNKNEEKDDQTQ